MRITDTHVYFYGGECCFSNWHTTKDQFKHREHIFQNSEQAFMYEKALCFNDIEIAEKILLTGDPKQVKALGRKIKNFDAAIWNDKCKEAMFIVNVAKYGQNKDFLKKLSDTGEKILVEASPYDKIWGVGLHWTDDKILDEKNWQGQNLLGKALMRVRQFFN
jgi:ribA/ribD-fused uncharacterized protein